MIRSCKKPPVYFPTVTGAICSFNSQYAGLPLKSHSVEVVATQSGSGTPSPDNVRPISGYSAINIGSDAKYAGFINFNQLIDASTLSDNFQWHNENITNNGSNKFTITFSSDETSRCWLICDLANDFTLVANHKYIMLPQFKISNGSLANYKFTFRFQNGNTQIDSTEQVDIQNGSIFIPTQSGNINKLSFYNYGDSTISSSTIITIQILLFDITQMFDSTIADYIYSLGKIEGVAYFRSLFPNDYYDYNAGTLTTVSAANGVSGSMNTIQIGSTVYGGEYDARTGVLTVTHKGVDLGSLTWTKESNHFYSNILSDAKYPPNNSNVAEIMCESYDVISEANVVSESFDYSIGMSRMGRIYIYDSSLSSGDATAFTTAVTGIKLVYKLATPQTIQLPPCLIDTLQGENNVWADTGNTTLEYLKAGR